MVQADSSGHLHCRLSSLGKTFADCADAVAAAVVFLHCKITNWNIVTSFIMWIFTAFIRTQNMESKNEPEVQSIGHALHIYRFDPIIGPQAFNFNVHYHIKSTACTALKV